MGKVLKAIMGPVTGLIVGGKDGLVQGLGNLAAVLTGNPLIIAASIGSTLLSPSQHAPKVSAATTERLFASIDARTPRKMWFGRTAANTDIRDQEYTDDQTYLHRFVVTASHSAEAYEEIWFDDKLAWTAGGGVQGEFVGYLTVATVLEGNAGNAINISARMGSSRRFTGCSYVHLKYKLTGNNKNTDSPFAQSIPSRLTIVGKGAAIYDPRLDSTVGGSGSQRADDQTTWAWDDDAARNPALQLLWYLLGWRIQNPLTSAWKLAVGKGIPPERIDLDSFITAANLCDEPVTLAVGGTEPRYRSDGVFSEGDGTKTVLDNFKAAMNADLDDVDGKIRLTVFHNDLAAPVASFTENDILGDFTWNQTQPLYQGFNIVAGGYTDPSSTSLYQLGDYPQVEIASPDAIDRTDTFPLPLVESISQGERLAKQRLERAQYGGTFSATFQATAWRVIKNDVIEQSFNALGWTNKKFRVVDTAVQVDGAVPMLLREEADALYAWDAEEAPAVTPVAPTTYDRPRNPIYLDLIEAGSWIADVQPIVVTADNTGTIDAGQLPVIRSVRRMMNSADVSADTAYAISSATAGITATVDDTSGSDQRGDVEMTALTAATGTIIVSTDYLGVTKFKEIAVNRLDAPPPTSGGGGGGGSFASTTSFAAPDTSTSHVVMATLAVLTVGASGQVDLSAALSFGVASEGRLTDGDIPAETFMPIKVQYSPDGSSWSDVGSEVTGSSATQYYSLSVPKGARGNAGSSSWSLAKTGLTPGNNAYFRIEGRSDTGNGILTVAGSFAATTA